MADKIRVNYPALEDMAKNCDAFAQRLRQTVSMANQIAQQMQNGTMQGEFGDIFVQALDLALRLLEQAIDFLRFASEFADDPIYITVIKLPYLSHISSFLRHSFS